MSLTKDDLQAIRAVVEDVVENVIEESMRQTAAGFEEVGHKIDALRNQLESATRIQNNLVERVDDHDKSFMSLRKALRAG